MSFGIERINLSSTSPKVLAQILEEIARVYGERMEKQNPNKRQQRYRRRDRAREERERSQIICLN